MSSEHAQTVLIVDDDPSIAETFSRLLQLEGFTVYTALDPEGGLEVAADTHPDAILLDLQMPILTGLQFLQRLRQNPALRHTPVTIVTGDYFIDDGTTSQLEALGASVRFKPLWMDDLVGLAQEMTAA
jgi:CheY-like chemotaxis protein